MKKIIYCIFCFMLLPVHASTVVATINGNPITDTDITARVQLMTRQGNVPTDNRRVALQNIIDDTVKLDYASNFGVKPSDKDVDNELKRMNLNDLSASEKRIARNAIRAGIAWQVIVARTVMPMIEVSDNDIIREKNILAREQGLPIEMEMIRLINIPTDVSKQLTKPSSCDGAIKIAESFGGAPQRFSALQYELSNDIRNRVVGLPLLTWSENIDNTVFLVCSNKKTKEYGNLDKMIRENAQYKQAMSMAEQQLKQLRRKAVVIINDDRYKL